PAKIVKLASEYEVAVGQSVYLHCQAEGNPKPTYAWNPCESVCHESTLNIPGVVSDGIYLCKVTNGLGSDTKHTSV
ncbi:Protein turtle A-like, partial [Desmophyllum pertusum]